MDTFCIERSGDRPLRFTGEKLADQTSYVKGKPEWTEVRFYRTATGRYVTETVGRSARPGRIDRCATTVSDDPEAMVASLRRINDEGTSYLTHIALAALDEAAAIDPAVEAALVERV